MPTIIRKATECEIEAFKVWNPEGATVLVVEDDKLGIVGHTAYCEQENMVFCYGSRVYVDDPMLFARMLLYVRKELKAKGYKKFCVHLSDMESDEIIEFWTKRITMKTVYVLLEGDL